MRDVSWEEAGRLKTCARVTPFLSTVDGLATLRVMDDVKHGHVFLEAEYLKLPIS